MAMSNDLQRDIKVTLNRWEKESAIHFCRLAQKDGSQFENITYPTGLKMVRVYHWLLAEAAEVPLRLAKELRANNYKVVSK